MAYTAPSPSPSASSTGESDSTFSSSSSSHLSSPSLLSSDLGLNLDASDPLNLLLKSATQSDPSATQPDWAELSTLWNGGESMKYPYPELMEFSSNMAIDPSTLQLDPSMSILNGVVPEDSFPFLYNEPHIPYPFPSDVMSAFTFQPPALDTFNEPQQRRLSVTSSASSSGASLSPVSEHPVAPIPVNPDSEASTSTSTGPSSAADDLAQLVMRSAGVMHAVPAGTQIGGYGVSLTVPAPQSQSKVPIPRLPRPATSAPTSAAPTPPPSSPSSGEPPQVTSVPSITIGASGRPKTSHTTIERRYRTNLNARIQSLRLAVPALRVMDRKSGKSVKKEDATNKDAEEDVIDDRGFVDGVRVARKCSKANVLGKAVEYIRVLKKRENRLKKEHAGLKSLLSGLVGGPALLREWEREWAAKFGGPETDELLESELVVRLSKSDTGNKHGDGDGSDGEEDDDDDGFDDGSDEDAGTRKKKKLKTAAAAPKAAGKEKKIQPLPQTSVISAVPQAIALASGLVVPEKRKRGRPRKNPLPSQPAVSSMPPATTSPLPPHPSTVTTKMEDVVMQAPSGDENQQSPPQSGHAQQYLLATFALFSFFNSPLTSSSFSSSSPGSNTGHVLNPLPNASYSAYPIQDSWGWHDVIQSFHLLVSILVFGSIVLPWTPFTPYSMSKKLEYVLHKIGLSSTSPPAHPQPRVVLTLAEALAPARRGTAGEAAGLKSALGVGQAGDSLRLWSKLWRNNQEGRGFERKGLEQRAWMRLGELAVLGGPSQTSLYSRIRTYIHMRAHVSWHHASPSDHITLALLLCDIPLFGPKNAAALWESAREKAGLCSGLPEKRREIISGLVNDVNRPVREYEKLVLRDLEVSDAVKKLRAMKVEGKKERYMLTPLGALAGTLVKERTKKHLAMQFISSVVPSSVPTSGRSHSPLVVAIGDRTELWDEDLATTEKRKTIDAARSLGGSLAELGDILERLHLHAEGFEHLLTPNLSSSEEPSSIDSDIRSLLNAVLLYKKIFPSSILVPSRTGGTHVGVSDDAGDAMSCGVSILLSPPPSPTQKDARVVYALRRALGSSVFDCNMPEAPKAEGLVDCADEAVIGVAGNTKDCGVIAWALEDARDRVVDMLVDLEMEGKGRIRS